VDTSIAEFDDNTDPGLLAHALGVAAKASYAQTTRWRLRRDLSEISHAEIAEAQRTQRVCDG